jgi:hypothetical protein
MSPLEWFGLGGDADERALKRAYAQRLRRTRPEDDPEGFQQLHAMYQRALAQCRRNPALAPASAGDGGGNGGPAGDAPPAAAAAAPPRADGAAPRMPAAMAGTDLRPPAVRFDLDGFCTQAIDRAASGDADALGRWLQARPEFWSLQLKTEAGRALVQRLYRERPPMPAACLDAILRFFDLHHATAGHDPLALQRLERHMQLAWELQPAHRAALCARLRPMPTVRTLDRQLALLEAPFRWSRVIALAVFPARIAMFVNTLTRGHPEDLPERFDRRAIRFWLDAADRTRITRARLLMGGIRWLAATLLGALLGCAIAWLDADPAEAGRLALGLGAVGFTMGLCWLAWMAYQPLDRWHGLPEHVAVRWPWLNLLLVPLLCGLGLGVNALLPHSVPALVVPVVAAWLAIRRCWRRFPSQRRPHAAIFRVAPFLIYPLARVLFVDADDVRGGFAYWQILTVPMLAWGLDLWFQRAHLRVRSRTAAQAD